MRPDMTTVAGCCRRFRRRKRECKSNCGAQRGQRRRVYGLHVVMPAKSGVEGPHFWIARRRVGGGSECDTQALHLRSIEPLTEPAQKNLAETMRRLGALLWVGECPNSELVSKTIKQQHSNQHGDQRPSCPRCPAVLCPDPSQNKNSASATA